LNAGLRLVDSVSPIADRLGESRPLPVETVARAAYRAAIDPGEPLLDVEDIRQLGR
jgi:NADH dehydrogenase